MLRRAQAAELDRQEGHSESLPIRAPNKGMELTAYSVRFAPASGATNLRQHGIP